MSSDRPVVCQLVHGLPIGGAEVLVNRLTRRLADEFQMVVACLDEVGALGEQLIDDGFEVCRLERRPGFDWRCVHRLAALLKSRGAAFVHAHQYTPFAYAAATGVRGRRPGVLFTEHGRFYPDHASRKRKWFNRVMVRRQDRFVAVGQCVRQALVDVEGFPARRIEIVYNGIPLDGSGPETTPRDEVRRELALSPEDFAVFQVARLDSIKDHATAIAAAAAAVRSAPRLRCFLVGEGPEADNIARAIEHHGVGERVRLLGLRRDVARLLSAADAFLLTSVSEGIPVTIIEAMAARVPVVATAVGGVPELVEHESTGLLAPAGDAAQLAAHLVRLSGDAPLRRRLSDAAHGRVLAELSEDQMVERYRRVYRQMIGVPSESAR